MRKVIFVIVVIVGIIWGITQLVKTEGNVGVAVSNVSGLSVGDCIQSNSDLDEVSCSSASAEYKVTRATDSNGSTCSKTDVSVISESRKGSTKHYCVKKV